MKVPIEYIEQVICADMRLKPHELHEQTRQSDIVEARYLIMYFASHRQNTTSECETYFGLKHPMTTYARRYVYVRCKNNKVFAGEIDRLEKLIDNDESVSKLTFISDRIDELQKILNEIKEFSQLIQ